MISTDHSPENSDEYVAYVRRHGEAFAVKYPFVYHRTGLPIYQPQLAADDTAVLNEVSYQTLLRMLPPGSLGGNQSVRKFVTKVGDQVDGEIVAVMPGHEADNYGNTVAVQYSQQEP